MQDVLGPMQHFQTETLQSAPFWIIVWSWRLLNPHAQETILRIRFGRKDFGQFFVI
jgi:hypothetical protein